MDKSERLETAGYLHPETGLYTPALQVNFLNDSVFPDHVSRFLL